jgi:hypothetical protein
MRRQQKVAGIDDEYAHPMSSHAGKVCRRYSAEHASPDNDDIEGVAAIVADLIPCGAAPAAEHIVRERVCCTSTLACGSGFSRGNIATLLATVLLLRVKVPSSTVCIAAPGARY